MNIFHLFASKAIQNSVVHQDLKIKPTDLKKKHGKSLQLTILNLCVIFVLLFPTSAASGLSPYNKINPLPNLAPELIAVTQPDSLSTRPVIARPEPRMGTRPSESTQEVEILDAPSPFFPAAEGDDSDSSPKHSVLFIENIGQFDPNAKFVLRGGNGIINLESESIWITTYEKKDLEKDKDAANSSDEPQMVSTPEPGEKNKESKQRKGVNLKLKFQGANPAATVTGIDRLDVKVSYFLGNDSNQWLTEAPVWSGVRYADFYPGVDLEIREEDGELNWVLVIRDENLFSSEMRNSGKPGEIRVLLDGGNGLNNVDGKVKAKTDLGEIQLPQFSVVGPDGIQLQKKSQEPVIEGNEIILLNMGDGSQPLSSNEPEGGSWAEHVLLKPALENNQSGTPDLFYSSYIGGSAADYLQSVAVSSKGEAYVVGEVYSTNYPTQGGLFQHDGKSDFAVTKFNQDGSQIIYSTFIGGADLDCFYDCDIAVGVDGSAFVIGTTLSPDFPTTENAYDRVWNGSDAFVLKINPYGTTLDYSSFFGGGGPEIGHGIALGTSNIVFVTGMTHSNDFPTTEQAFDRTPNEQEVFVSKFNLSNSGAASLVYSTYVGGSSSDQGHGIAVRNGFAYVVGQTQSTDFPTRNAFDTSANGDWDSFVFKLNPDGKSLGYSTYFGGSARDCEETGDGRECTIAVDGAGFAYVTGFTYSSDFPLYGAFDTTLEDYDAYVAKFSPNGSLIYSSYLGGSSGDRGLGIAANNVGAAYVTGFSSSTNFPITGNALDSTVWGRDGFLAKISPNGSGIEYASFWGGTGDDISCDIQLDDAWVVYLAGRTTAPDFPLSSSPFDGSHNGGIDGTIAIMGTGVYNSRVSDEGTRSGCDPESGDGDDRECPKPQYESQDNVGQPINTRTGALEYSVGDISVPTPAGQLVFQRIYSSDTITMFSDLLGYGWTHNHDSRLIFPGDPSGEAGIVKFKAHSANTYSFTDNGDGTYTPFTGVIRTLTRQDGPPVTYIVTDAMQRSYFFDAEGTLLEWVDEQGFTWFYSYDASNRLIRVTDETTQRYLQLNYDGQGRIDNVSDYTGRDVVYLYDGNGDLGSVVDIADETWTLTYDGAHRLRIVASPAGQNVLHTEYDASGKAFQQYAPDGTLNFSLTYNADNTTTIIDTQNRQLIDIYDSRNAFMGQMDSQNNSTGKRFDYQLQLLSVTNMNGNGPGLTWSAEGENLLQYTDPAGGQTDLTYDDLNNLETIIDPRGYLTTYTYDGALLTSSTDALDNTTSYTYTTAADAPQPEGLLKTITQGGLTTSFVYDALGQQIALTDPQGLTTTYGYDVLGRTIRVTSPDQKSNWTCYDDAGRVTRSVQNATGDGSTPQTDPCDPVNYVPSSDPNYDRISSTVYDESDNIIATVAPNGLITRTYFDANNRPTVFIQNLNGQSIEEPIPPAYNPADPNHNLRTETIYDVSSNVIATIDTLGHITRTYYDSNNRAQFVVRNLSGQVIETATPPAYDPAYPDRNILTEMVYDAGGRTIATIDTLGRITRTYYDAADRPEYVVQNLTGQVIAVETPPVYNPSYPDQNVRTQTVYDAAGNAIASIDALGVITRTYYDALNRPQTVVQNLVGQIIATETAPVFDPAFPAQNVPTDNFYDASGNLVATMDPLGVVTRTYYDSFGRAYLTVANLFGQTIEEPTPPAYDPAYPDRNVRQESVFDSQGRTIATLDPLGKITRTYFDELDRPYLTVRNLTGQSISTAQPPVFNPAFPDENVRSETVYDVEGRAIASIDNGGIISRNYYDELGRVFASVQNLTGQTIDNPLPPTFDPLFPDRNVRTDTLYGPGGLVLHSTDSSGRVTHMCYDNIGRTVKTITNPSVADPCTAYTLSPDTDRDIIHQTVYDGLGNQLSAIDANGKTTSFEYDALYRLTAEVDPLLHRTAYSYNGLGNRISMTNAKNTVTRYEYSPLNQLSAVIENYRPGVTANQEINVRTEYTYDANGQRKTIKNSLNKVSSYWYDALGRLTNEIDPLNHTTTYYYDGAGNRTGLLDANGATTIYAYDDLHRLEGVDYPAPDADVVFTYDASGNRATMTDGIGTTRWEYDDLNRPSEITDPFNGSVGYTYDAAGNRKTLTYPDNKVVDYQYDNAGRLHLVTDWQSLTTIYTYDRGGRPDDVDLPNGVSTNYVFDDAGRLLNLSHSDGITTLSSFQYGYDDVGNRTSLTETVTQPLVSPDDLIMTDSFES